MEKVKSDKKKFEKNRKVERGRIKVTKDPSECFVVLQVTPQSVL